MEMDIIKWDMDMARRCIKRVAREKENRAVPQNALRSTQASGTEGADYWDEFRKAIDDLLKG